MGYQILTKKKQQQKTLQKQKKYYDAPFPHLQRAITTTLLTKCLCVCVVCVCGGGRGAGLGECIYVHLIIIEQKHVRHAVSNSLDFCFGSFVSVKHPGHPWVENNTSVTEYFVQK